VLAYVSDEPVASVVLSRKRHVTLKAYSMFKL